MLNKTGLGFPASLYFIFKKTRKLTHQPMGEILLTTRVEKSISTNVSVLAKWNDPYVIAILALVNARRRARRGEPGMASVN